MNSKEIYEHSCNIKNRCYEKEDILKKDPEYAFYYAWKIIGARWKEAEEYIKKRKPDSKAFRKDILQMVVFNLNTEVAASLNMMSRVAAERALEAIYAGCIMLNPGLDIDYWINIAYSTAPIDPIGIDDDLNIKKLKEYIKGHYN